MQNFQGNLQNNGGQGNLSAFLPYDLTAARVAAAAYKHKMGELASLERAGTLMEMAYLYEAASLLGLAGVSALELKQIANQAAALQAAGSALEDNNPFVPGSGMEQEALENANDAVEEDEGLATSGQTGEGEELEGQRQRVTGDGLEGASASESPGTSSNTSQDENAPETAGGESQLGSENSEPEEKKSSFYSTLPGRKSAEKKGEDKQESETEKEPAKEASTTAGGDEDNKQAGDDFVAPGNLPEKEKSTKNSKEKGGKTESDKDEDSKEEEKEANEQAEQTKKRMSFLRRAAAFRKGGVPSLKKEVTKQVEKYGSEVAYTFIEKTGLGFIAPTFGLSLILMVFSLDVLWFLSFVLGFKLPTTQVLRIVAYNIVLIIIIVIIIAIILALFYYVCQTPGLGAILGALATNVCSPFNP